MRKRFLMVVALIVALSVPLRVPALAAEASEDLSDESYVVRPDVVSEVQPVEEIPNESSSVECYLVDDISFLSQTYALGSGVMAGQITLRFEEVTDAEQGSGGYRAVIQIGSQVYYFPGSSDTTLSVFFLKPAPSGGYFLKFRLAYIQELWSFIALLCLCNGGYTFVGGGDGESIDYSSILNEILSKINILWSDNNYRNDVMIYNLEHMLTKLEELRSENTYRNDVMISYLETIINDLKKLDQLIAGNAAVQQAVKDMHSALLGAINSTTASVDTLGDELQQRFDEVMTTLDEGLTAQGQVLQDMTGRMDSMETALKDSVGGSFQIDASASGSVDSVGTEGFELISSTLDQMLSSFSWISSLVGVFLMIVLAKRILT